MAEYDAIGRTLTVTEANAIIRDTVAEFFSELTIEGEVSGFRPSSSGHWYFTLKDSQAALDAAVFRSAQYSMTVPRNGDLVIAKGSLSYYAKNGRLSFVIRSMRIKGEGSLLEMIEKRKDYYRSLGYFDEDMITVMSPVTQGFSTKGYLLIHSPVSLIDEKCRILMVPVLITLGVIYLLSFIFLIGFHFFVYRPLRQITEAAKQYASGNLDYEIPVYTHDEIGYLSASLNYMAVQLKDMDDYQKKIVANVSHDFRSPLTSIKGYVEAMNDGTIPPELHEKYLRIILFETERLTDLTTDLLTLNEFDTKELLLDKTKFDIQEVIKTTAESFEGVCTPKHISIELLLLPGEILVYADRRKIQQVLYNLIDNAIKFSENNSSITIEVVEKNGKVFISVKDHGIGIPKKALNKIWERFYKSDLSRGKDKKGTGLGLSIVKEVIQAHDEHINVISTEGVGTEFIFSLSRS